MTESQAQQAAGVDSTDSMKISVVIPIYNEERTLAEIVRRVLATPHDIELILVDDGSKDSTREIMARLEAEHEEVRCFYHEQNTGKGGAIATGFKMITGDVALIQDADLEYDPRDYTTLLQPIKDGVADVVYGSRFLGGTFVRVHLYWHYLGNRALTTLSNMFTNLNLTDMETCYKVFKAPIAKKLDIQSSTFALEPEMTAKVAKMRARIYEVPISYAGRDYADGKKIGLKDAFIAVWAILRWNLFYSPPSTDL
ncbi:MAG: glycosyltransferase involved in cell wall biosynthesis [Planctomycetota bacterium]|jgi:glycosyltransferase involved in cell wall biosynthesis